MTGLAGLLLDITDRRQYPVQTQQASLAAQCSARRRSPEGRALAGSAAVGADEAIAGTSQLAPSKALATPSSTSAQRQQWMPPRPGAGRAQAQLAATATEENPLPPTAQAQQPLQLRIGQLPSGDSGAWPSLRLAAPRNPTRRAPAPSSSSGRQSGWAFIAGVSSSTLVSSLPSWILSPAQPFAPSWG